MLGLDVMMAVIVAYIVLKETVGFLVSRKYGSDGVKSCPVDNWVLKSTVFNDTFNKYFNFVSILISVSFIAVELSY